MAKRSEGVLRLDDRQRLSLGRFADHDMYHIKVRPNGTIELTPVALMHKPSIYGRGDDAAE